MKRVEPGERAALYYRVSTEEQEREGLSLDAQRDSLVKYAEDNKLKIVGEFRDGGYSARKKWKSRPAFVELINSVERNEIDIILFIKLDRWFRSIADYYEVQKILDAHNVRWIAILEDYDTTTASGRLNLNIRLSIAQDEADRTAERIKFVFEDKKRRKEAITGKMPLGYIVVNKRIEIEEESAKIVRAIFDKYIATRSLNAVARWLNQEQGIRTDDTRVKKTIKNKKYIGIWHGIEDFSPAIISEDKFRLANKILVSGRAQRNEGKNITYIFSGLCVCSECGGRLESHSVKSSNGEMLRYYRCYNKIAYGNCSGLSINEEALERYAVQQLQERIDGSELMLSDEEPKVADVSEIKAKLARLTELYVNDMVDIDAYKEQYEYLRTQLAEAERYRQDTPIGSRKDLLDGYELLSRDSKKAFWSALNCKIAVYPDKTAKLIIN